MTVRAALLIANFEYEDPALDRLLAPANDVDELAAVLADGRIAGFEVTTLINEPHHRVGRAIGEFYRHRGSDDLVVLYFSGHGLRDEDGRLHLAAADTRLDNLLFTALPAETLDRGMESCGSRRKVLILDCCYSGAFPDGWGRKGVAEVHAVEKLQGRGRTVLTASDAAQYSFEGEKIDGEPVRSVFTKHLVAGLRDGSADLDGDGDVTLDELYSYVYERVVAEVPQQRPKKKDDIEGRLVLARNVNWRLPPYLRDALGNPMASVRLSALDGLARLRQAGNETVQASAAGAGAAGAEEAAVTLDHDTGQRFVPASEAIPTGAPDPLRDGCIPTGARLGSRAHLAHPGSRCPLGVLRLRGSTVRRPGSHR